MYQPKSTSALINESGLAPERKFFGRHYRIKIAVNFLLYLLTYIVFYFINKKSLVFDSRYILFLPVLIGSWGIGGLLSGKFSINSGHSFIARVKRCSTALLISLGVTALMLMQLNFSISRFVVVGSLTSAALIETIIEFFRSGAKIDIHLIRKEKISYALLMFDLFILVSILYFFYEVRVGFNNINEKHVLLLAATLLCWFFASMISHQFRPFGSSYNFWKAIGNQLKTYFLLIALTSFIVYMLQLPDYYTSLYLTSVLLYSIWSFILVIFVYIDKLPEKTDEVKSDFLHAYELKIPQLTTASQREKYVYRLNGEKNNSGLNSKLKYIFLNRFPGVLDFIQRKLDLSTFDTKKTIVLRSDDPYNLLFQPENEIELFINLHKMNDVRRINEYFINVNKILIDGGVFVGNFEPIHFRYKRFLKRYPFFLAHFLYLLDFLWHRAAPKMPVLRKIFFAINKGKDRAISLAECFGRLYYCGFEVLDLKALDNVCYFVAKKIKEPSADKNPSYSPLFKMRRVGKNGKTVFIYKLRTMHPYSEYLQEFVYKNNSLQEGGKFKDDFRITSWGKVLRKFWIDELPMLINLFRGDCKLVGVRPLSQHYLSLYDEEYRKRRLKYKPGLIPPYYADMPKTVEEIIKSEENYLNEFDRAPLKTDIKYFSKAFNNIVINHKRSA